MSDISQALRQLARNPGFTAVAVLALALGIGVNSVMFSLADAILFRPLPVRDPERLVRVGMTDQKGIDLGGVSYPQLKELAREARSFSGLVGTSDGALVNLGIDNLPAERATAASVSGNYFEVLGLIPVAGRLLGPADDTAPGAHPVLVLSEAYWKRRFDSDPRVVGAVVRMNTHPYTVLGVAPRGFHGTNLDEVPDVWIPLTMAEQVSPNIAQFKPFERRGFTWVNPFGRLKEGASISAALAELSTINARINAELKLSREGDRYDRFRVLPMSETIVEPSRLSEVTRSSWVLIGVTGLVLIIACSVAAGLLLVRGEQRQRELAVRLAVGASRMRLVRLLLAESLLIASVAAVLGVAIANWSTSLFVGLAPSDFPLPLAAATPILESRVLWFTAGLALLSTFAFGLLPALKASRPDLAAAMKLDGGGFSSGPRAFSLRNGFVVVQVALSAVLLVGAGLLLRTIGEASRVDLGFDTDNALVVSLDVSKSGYSPEKGRLFYAQLLDEVRALQGVRSAAISRHVPVQSAGMITTVTLSNVASVEGREPEVAFTPVSPDFFKTLGLRIEEGRDFARSDEGGAPVLAVNRAFADRFWPGRDALRERVLNFGPQGATVIAVIADARLTSLRESREPMIYVPVSDFYVPSTSLIVRTMGSPRALLPSVSGVVTRLDRTVPVLRARTLREHVGQAMAQEKVTASLLSAFGALALVLAGIGLYGVIGYTTQIRGREFGVRLALGASPRALLFLVLGQGACLAAVGVTLGLIIAAGSSRVLQSMLFGVSPTDGVTFTAIAGVLLVVAVVASAGPAWRASRVDPIRALRAE
jgi:predicted permease